ncbi:hypothetical protein BOTNAR_0108g00190 [Botryotinia narcissicola]|uniref:Uncharacterized protein n=1 Tax=Botryotinia narcissicola TaxID=278944 RepID=A0A4Z1IN25_9HELO|nr:hypothetical protein BOTNAR_0108g00190 [Botryotinia narcissicola]
MLRNEKLHSALTDLKQALHVEIIEIVEFEAAQEPEYFQTYMNSSAFNDLTFTMACPSARGN